MTPYQEGVNAYWRGDSKELNPYDDKDQQHEDWNTGYDDGWQSEQDTLGAT